MHDYFDILGVPPGACAQEIRRARRRRGVSHPDVHDGDLRANTATAVSVAARPVPPSDVAVDFVDMTDIVNRMQAAFFARL